MSLRDPAMRSWLTKRSQEYLTEHVQYIGLLDEEKEPLSNLPRVPIDWANAKIEGFKLVAPDVVWEVPPLFIPRYFGFYTRLTGGTLLDWWEAPETLTEADWSVGFEYRTAPIFTIN